MKITALKGSITNRNATIIIMVFLFCLFLGLIFVLPIQNTYETQELKMDVIVGNYTGINLDTDAVHFGTIKKEDPALRMREVVIINSYNESKEVFLSVDGKLSKWAALSENHFILSPNENKSIEVTLKISSEIGSGTYYGILKAVFKEAE